VPHLCQKDQSAPNDRKRAPSSSTLNRVWGWANSRRRGYRFDRRPPRWCRPAPKGPATSVGEWPGAVAPGTRVGSSSAFRCWCWSGRRCSVPLAGRPSVRRLADSTPRLPGAP
jgi:hypothetical protein